jgi:hypothetical protein
MDIAEVAEVASEEKDHRSGRARTCRSIEVKHRRRTVDARAAIACALIVGAAATGAHAT